MLVRHLLLAATLSLPVPAFAQHTHHTMQPSPHRAGTQLREPGQSAFAAVQEIVALLEADPKTDWGQVNIEALRQHLIDMDNVTLRARVDVEPVDGGARFVVTGGPDVAGSIGRMVKAHAATMNGVGGWRMSAEDRPGGAAITVASPRPADAARMRALGFIGIMTRGMHHQQHHLMLARGIDPHR